MFTGATRYTTLIPHCGPERQHKKDKYANYNGDARKSQALQIRLEYEIQVLMSYLGECASEMLQNNCVASSAPLTHILYREQTDLLSGPSAS